MEVKKFFWERVRDILKCYPNVEVKPSWDRDIAIVKVVRNWTDVQGKQIYKKLEDSGITLDRHTRFQIPAWAHKKDPVTGLYLNSSQKPRVMTIYGMGQQPKPPLQ